MKQISVQIKSRALPDNASYLYNPVWIAHQVERLKLLLPEASHSATNDLLTVGTTLQFRVYRRYAWQL